MVAVERLYHYPFVTSAISMKSWVKHMPRPKPVKHKASSFAGGAYVSAR